MIEIIQIIESVGFPIFCCIFVLKQNQQLSKSIADLNNTLTSIDRRIEYLEKEVNRYVKD